MVILEDVTHHRRLPELSIGELRQIYPAATYLLRFLTLRCSLIFRLWRNVVGDIAGFHRIIYNHRILFQGMRVCDISWALKNFVYHMSRAGRITICNVSLFSYDVYEIMKYVCFHCPHLNQRHHHFHMLFLVAY